MPGAMDMSSFNPMLLEWLNDPVVIGELIYGSNSKLFTLLNKVTTGEGEYAKVPAIISGSQGKGPQFSAAFNGQTAGTQRSFQIPFSDYYGLQTIENKTWRASRTNRGAFENSLKVSFRSAIEELMKDINWKIYRAGTGTLGVISNITAGVVTLVTPSDAMIFEVGQQFLAYTADGGGSALSAVGYVIGTDPQNGTVTFSSNAPPPGGGGTPGTPAGWSTANAYLVPLGAQNNDPVGVLAWTPIGTVATPVTNGGVRPVSGTPSPFYAVDRAPFPQKLAGTFVDTTKNSPGIEQALIRGVSVQTKFLGKPDVIMVNNDSYEALEAALTGRRNYQTIEAMPGVGFEGMRISAGGSNPIVISDPFCPPKTALSLQLSTWDLLSYGPFPQKLAMPSGAEWIDIPNADQTQGRYGGHLALACNAPGKNAVFKLTV